MPYAIGILAHEQATRTTVAEAVARQPDTRLAFAVAVADAARREVATAPPSLIVVDLDLPAGDALAFVRELQGLVPPLEAVVLTGTPDGARVAEALCAGAVGHLDRGAPAADADALLATLRAGGASMSPEVARLVRDVLLPEVELCEVAAGDGTLTEREREVLALLAEGCMYENVAARLSLSPHTIRAHVRNIYRKLHVNSRAQAVYEALKRRIIHLG